MKYLKLFSWIISTSFLLSACGPEPDFDENDADLNVDSAYDDYSPRRGKLTVEFSINQAHDKKTEEGRERTLVEMSYALHAMLEQDVFVVDDFRYFDRPAGDPETDSRLDYFNSSPFWNIDGIDSTITGQLSYTGLYQHEDPDAVDFVALKNTNSGKAQLDWFEIADVEPSVYGEGMEFKLDWVFVGSEDKTEYSSHRGGHVIDQSDTDKEKEFGGEDFHFYPAPSFARLSEYPYAFEHDEHTEFTENARQLDRDLLDGYTEIANQDYDTVKFFGVITDTTKDKMTIRYEKSGRLINLNNLFPIPFRPNIKSAVSVTITLEADE